MNISYVLYLEESAQQALASALTELGCKHTDEIGVWSVPVSARPRVKEITEPFAPHSFRFMYSLSTEETDDPDRLAAFLGVSFLEDREDQPRCILAKDPDDFSLIGNNELRDALGGVEGISWTPRSEAGLWRLAPTSALPDPLRIPNPVDMSQGEDGLWHILGDGRTIVSIKNLDHLQEHGVAYSNRRSTSEGTFDVRPIAVFGKRFIDAVQEAGVTMPIAPIYLIPEDMKVEEW
ncbi:hypothetical protein ACH4D4_23925 [Streptomyces pristinaespiralis]|jgi:hypothetical protein|uniref:hypothetical protein n=1 Tax=Streptomyces pristinaespiralis TaxID=38300 RepID=UPI0034098D85